MGFDIIPSLSGVILESRNSKRKPENGQFVVKKHGLAKYP
jgi:hypothetical protein